MINNVQLELRPYNDLWLDCVQNNLMSVLIKQNDSFNILPLTFKAQYWKKLISQKFSSQETYNSLIKQGLFLPKVVYNADELFSFFYMNERIIDPTEVGHIHMFIKEALLQQQYVFLSIDRFYYRSGRESGKFHFVHPTFIQGYSDEEENYIAMEDCLTPGRMHPYNIPYEVIDLSASYFIETGTKIVLRTVSLNLDKISKHQYDISEISFLEMYNCVNDDEIVYVKEYDLYYHVGITSLDHYIDEAEEILTNINDEKMFALRTSSFIQNHKKNSLLLNNLYSNGRIKDYQFLNLAEQFKALSVKWEVYKNITLKRFQLKDNNDLTKIKDCLTSIALMERSIANNINLYFN